MPQPIGIQVDGARQLRRELKAAGDDLGDLKAANNAAAQLVATGARSGAPRLTGRLAASVRGAGAASSATIRAGKKAVPYAAPIHWGWGRRNIAANPWISREAKRLEPVWTREYAAAVDAIVARITTGVAP